MKLPKTIFKKRKPYVYITDDIYLVKTVLRYYRLTKRLNKTKPFHDSTGRYNRYYIVISLDDEEAKGFVYEMDSLGSPLQIVI